MTRNIGVMLVGVAVGAASVVLVGWMWFILSVVSIPMEVIAGGDAVTPHRARAGDVIKVRRSFRITRLTQLQVYRVMIRGDCAKGPCEVIHISSSPLILPIGEYRAIEREHVVPRTAGPGNWILVFTVSQEVLGFRSHMTLPVLSLEIVE